MNTFSNVPPGFRFHPTDEELVDYYLRKKVNSKRIDLDVIKDVDLYKIEPWDLQDKCRIGAGEEEQSEWYFFSHKDRKYPTGSRTNRATAVGFWKATGRDKPIYAGRGGGLVGMRKTLVFYRGRAPNGRKSDFIMHEYRLETSEHGAPQEEGWVVCRVFKKQVTATQRAYEYESPCWGDEQQVTSFPELDMPYHHHHHHFNPKEELELDLHHHWPQDHFLHHLPQLDSPTMPVYNDNISANMLQSHSSLTQGLVQYSVIHQQQHSNIRHGNVDRNSVDQVTDWRVLDRFVASQLSQDDGPKETNGYPCATDLFQVPDHHEQEEGLAGAECAASTSNSSCQIDLWK